MTNPTTKTETHATHRLRELVTRYAQTALDLEHPAPHWDLTREARVLAGQRADVATAISIWRHEGGNYSGAVTDALIDAVCAAGRTYHAARAEYLRAPGKPDHAACATAWQAVEDAAAGITNKAAGLTGAEMLGIVE